MQKVDNSLIYFNTSLQVQIPQASNVNIEIGVAIIILFIIPDRIRTWDLLFIYHIQLDASTNPAEKHKPIEKKIVGKFSYTSTKSYSTNF